MVQSAQSFTMLKILPCLIHFLQLFKYVVSLPNKDDVEAYWSYLSYFPVTIFFMPAIYFGICLWVYRGIKIFFSFHN